MKRIKLTKQELENLIMEELRDIDEGVWDKLKGVASGVGTALTSPLGKIGQGYSRGKAASVLKTAAIDLEAVREEFIDNIEGIFKPMFSDTIEVPPELEDVQQAWNTALDQVEKAAETFERLSLEIKQVVTRGRSRKASWQRNPQSERIPPSRQLPSMSPAEE
jgi:hypothetical protein